MGERRILVIGSQCDAAGQLAFLPAAAEELYAVMTDPERGACLPALEESGLVIDPSVHQVVQAIESAYLRAAKEEATLFIAYVGHGAALGRTFYLLPKDAKPYPLSSRTAVPLIDLIVETHLNVPELGKVDGLAVLLDTCHSGLASHGATQTWIPVLEGSLRFEMLTATADDQAANGCFTRTLTHLMREGIETEPSEYLLGMHLRPLIENLCPDQVPQHPTWNLDKTLWLSRNAGRISEPWAHTALAEEIQRLTVAYQPTPALAEIIEHFKTEGCIAILSEAGSGKSALVAALGWPKITAGLVPAGFVQAVAFIDEATTPSKLASTIAQQLARSVPGFQKAQEKFNYETACAEQQKAGTLEKALIGPLKRLAVEAEVRLAVDALDRLATGAREAVIAALEELASLPFVRLLVTARPDTKIPKGASVYQLARASGQSVQKYLAKLEIPEARREEIAKAAQGNWLIMRVLVDLIRQRPDAEIRRVGEFALDDAYEDMLTRCGAFCCGTTNLILEVLAAAGGGPLLPLRLLCKASEILGGPARLADVRDQLVQLRGLAVRSSAGTQQEQAGLFHQTLVEYVAARGPERNRAAHHALLAAIAALVPLESAPLDLGDPVHRYIFEREAEHLWAVGDVNKALAVLSARLSPAPRDNLRRWTSWQQRVQEKFGINHPFSLAARGNFARWTGESGDTKEALQLFRALLREQEKIFGPDHHGTLMVRHNIAAATARCGDRIGALQLYQTLLRDQERVLGRCHPDTLLTRGNIGRSTGELGGIRQAIQLLRDLLTDQLRVLGPHHPECLRTRDNIAYFTGHGGNIKDALRLFQELGSDQERVLGYDHPDSLRTRNSIAHFIGLSRDAKQALRQLHVLLRDQERVLGPNHPDTLITKYNLAFWLASLGNYRRALKLVQALLPELEHTLGSAHPEALKTKMMIALLSDRRNKPLHSVGLSRSSLRPVDLLPRSNQ